MPVMILAIASFIFFLLTVALLYIADTLESRTRRDRCRASIQVHGLPLLSITEAFDPVFSVLWAAPIGALQRIDSTGAAGLPIATLRPIYAAAAASFPEMYDGCNFLQWIQFLEGTGLIVRYGDRAVLTGDGQAFLRFRFVTDALVEA
jgi:hypothetical protein